MKPAFFLTFISLAALAAPTFAADLTIVPCEQAIKVLRPIYDAVKTAVDLNASAAAQRSANEFWKTRSTLLLAVSCKPVLLMESQLEQQGFTPNMIRTVEIEPSGTPIVIWRWPRPGSSSGTGRVEGASTIRLQNDVLRRSGIAGAQGNAPK